MPESIETNTSRKARWRAQRRAAGLPIAPPRPPRPPKPPRTTPRQHKVWHKILKKQMAACHSAGFIGLVCVGAGTSKGGQQHCGLLVASDGSACEPSRTRTSLDLCRFLTSLPPTAEGLLVTYHLAYLAAFVLADVPPERLGNDKKRGVLDERQSEGSSYTYWNDFGIDYLPGNYLRICKLTRTPVVDPVHGHTWIKYAPVEGSSRTVSDVSGCFRKPLVKALRDFGVGPEHWEGLALARSERVGLKRATIAVRKQAATEAGLLADLMSRFRALCHDADLWPKYWSGAGKLANYLHDRNKTLTAKQLAGLVPGEVLTLARRAFHGGRFEVTRIGEVEGPLWSHDLNAAYPAAMLELPCLRHSRWIRLGPGDFSCLPAESVYLADVSFAHDRGLFLCGLPVRKKESLSVLYPTDGSGIYWSGELKSAERLGARIERKAGWLLTRHCRCQQFQWVRDLYLTRQGFGDLRGEPIKAAMAALYGKLIQRKGSARYENYIWGSLLTSIVRTWINDAIGQAPESVVMVAADALYSKQPLSLPLGDALGQWKVETLPGVFIVQSGLWWGAKRPRTRGAPVNLFEPHVSAFEQAWRGFRASGSLVRPPVVNVPLTLFTGVRLAHARKDLAQSRTLNSQGRPYAFFWAHKRGRPEWEGNAVRTWPLGSGEVSLGHGEAPDLIEELDMNRLDIEAMPDLIDLSIPFRP